MAESNEINSINKKNNGEVNINEPQEQTTKPLKPEEKPFNEFIKQHLIPELSKNIKNKTGESIELSLDFSQRPIVGGDCWVLLGKISNGRKFCVCFEKEELTSKKTICLSEPGAKFSLLESFLIDEKKATLALLLSRILQRLNGQKWLGDN